MMVFTLLQRARKVDCLIRHFEVAPETAGSRWLPKCIMGLFLGDKCAAML